MSKKKKTFPKILAVLLVGTSIVLLTNNKFMSKSVPQNNNAVQAAEKVETTKKNANSFEYINSLVKSSAVICTSTKPANIYLKNNQNSNIVEKINQDKKLEILQDKSTKWYKVKDLSNEKIGWIKNSYINIPPNPNTNTNKLTKNQLEIYINHKNFESHTNQFIWVDIDRQLTYVFEGSKNNWELIKTINIASGLNESPTTRGTFKIGQRGKWFYANRFSSGAINWVRFNGSYLFHSVSMDKNQNIIDPTLGQRKSSGCIRMSVEDSNWFYKNIKTDTTVFVN